MRTWGPLLLAAGLSVAGCGGTDPEPAPTEAPPAAATPAPAPIDAFPECEQATSRDVDAIETGLATDGAGSLADGYAVPLPAEVALSVDRVVAADIQAPGMEGDGPVGVWAVGDANVYALDPMAREFSDWGAEIRLDSRVGAALDEVAQLSAVGQVRDCQQAHS